jgi:hypothetical protein
MLNLYFHMPLSPVNKDDNNYNMDGVLPTIGEVKDLSISINYKF